MIKIIIWMEYLKETNHILFNLLIFIISYLSIGLLCSIIYILTFLLKEKTEFNYSVPRKHVISDFFTIIFIWPFTLRNVYETFQSQMRYIGYILCGRTVKRRLLGMDNIIKIRSKFYEDKLVKLKQLRTPTVMVDQEQFYEKSEGDNYKLIYKVDITMNGTGEEKTAKIEVDADYDDTNSIEFIQYIQDNGMAAFQHIATGEEKNLTFDTAPDLELHFEADVDLCDLSKEFNSIYILKHDDKEDTDKEKKYFKIRNRFVNEYHFDTENKNLLIIDYANKESYAVNYSDGVKRIFVSKFDDADPESHITRFQLDKDTILNYRYDNDGIVQYVEPENKKDTTIYYLRIDEVMTGMPKTTVTYPVPFVKDVGNIRVYSENCRLYCTDSVVYDKNNEMLSHIKEFRIFTDKEEQELRTSFKNTILNNTDYEEDTEE